MASSSLKNSFVCGLFISGPRALSSIGDLQTPGLHAEIPCGQTRHMVDAGTSTSCTFVHKLLLHLVLYSWQSWYYNCHLGACVVCEWDSGCIRMLPRQLRAHLNHKTH